MDASAIVVAALAGALGASVTAGVTWLIAKRTTSGTVATSTADMLWKQNQQFVDNLLADNQALRALLESRDSEIEMWRTKMHRLEVRQQQSELAESECNERADKLQKRVATLERALNIDAQQQHTERVVVQGEHLEAQGPERAE